MADSISLTAHKNASQLTMRDGPLLCKAVPRLPCSATHGHVPLRAASVPALVLLIGLRDGIGWGAVVPRR